MPRTHLTNYLQMIQKNRRGGKSLLQTPVENPTLARFYPSFTRKPNKQGLLYYSSKARHLNQSRPPDTDDMDSGK